jgi:hypothetical protein
MTQGARPSGPKAEDASPPRRWFTYATLAVAIALLCAALIGAYESGSLGTNARSLRAEERNAAVRLREAAHRACAQGQARNCIGLYNEAKKFDPQGDLASEVGSDRAYAATLLTDTAVEGGD